MNKYVFRRLLAGIVITPLVALTYSLIYIGLVVMGAGQTSSVGDIWANGLLFGVAGSVMFALFAWGKN